MGKIVEIKDSTFKEEVTNSNIPVIVDFWAEWCGPCKALAPIVDEIAKEFDGKIKIGKINVDENIKTATDMAVMNIPALVFFKGGKEAGRVVGVVSKKELYKKIEDIFSG